METKTALTELLALSLVTEKSQSKKKVQYAKMRGGKVRKFLNRVNDESKKQKSGIKL